jgi:hypothetical protein
VGDTPQVTPGSLENASLVTWTEILTQNEQIGKEKQRLASEFSIQVADQIHGIEVRFDDVKKRYSAYNDQLVETRDAAYTDLKKAKSAYDASCQKMEERRLKASKSFDKSKEKAQSKLDEKEADMNNAKNLYLIKINVANRVKDKYYREDIPELLDGLQDVNQARVALVNAFWKQSVNLEKSCVQRCVSSLDRMTAIVEQNKPTLDSAMFVKHNQKSWSDPVDFVYEPSSIWHDDEKMVTDDTALRYLRKRLSDSSTKLDNETRVCETKLEEYKKVVEVKKDISGMNSNNLTIVLNKHLASLQALTAADTARLIQGVEVETIEKANSGKDLSSIPVETTVKRRGIFGRRKSVKEVQHLSRTVTNLSQSSAGSGSTKRTSFMSSFLHRGKSHKKSVVSVTDEQHVRALYSYSANGDDEISVSEGQDLVVVDPDDGTGWVNVRAGAEVGLVPASYVENVLPSMSTESVNTVSTSGSGTKKKGPAVAPKRGAKKVSYMIALYDYDAQAPDELTIRAGDKILVVEQDTGNGWTQGELNAMGGAFPTSYAKIA